MPSACAASSCALARELAMSAVRQVYVTRCTALQLHCSCCRVTHQVLPVLTPAKPPAAP